MSKNCYVCNLSKRNLFLVKCTLETVHWDAFNVYITVPNMHLKPVFILQKWWTILNKSPLKKGLLNITIHIFMKKYPWTEVEATKLLPICCSRPRTFSSGIIGFLRRHARKVLLSALGKLQLCVLGSMRARGESTLTVTLGRKTGSPVLNTLTVTDGLSSPPITKAVLGSGHFMGRCWRYKLADSVYEAIFEFWTPVSLGNVKLSYI